MADHDRLKAPEPHHEPTTTAQYRATNAQAIGDGIAHHLATRSPISVHGAVLGPEILGVTGKAIEASLDGWLAPMGGRAVIDAMIEQGRAPAPDRDRWQPAIAAQLGTQIDREVRASAAVVEHAGPPLPTVFDVMVRKAVEHRVEPTSYEENARIRKTDASLLVKPDTAAQYLRFHRPAFDKAIAARLAAARPATGDPRLHWYTASFADAVVTALDTLDRAAILPLIHPVDAYELVDKMRVLDETGSSHGMRVGAMGWQPEIGVMFASAIEDAIRASLPRMAARYVARRPAAASELVSSHPMDRIVAMALCTPDVVVTDAAATRGDDGHDVQRDGLRAVRLTWLGATQPTLWNWARIEAPFDARPEEIAAAIIGKPEFAYGLTIDGPLVQVPAMWCLAIPQAISHKPTSTVVTGTVRFAHSSVDLLGHAALTEEVAAAEARDVAFHADHATKVPALDRVKIVDRLASTITVRGAGFERLRPYDGRRVADDGFLQAKLAWAKTAPLDDLAPWMLAFDRQHAVAVSAVESIGEVLDVVTPADGGPIVAASIPPLVIDVLRAYGTALETLALVEGAERQLATAHELHQRLGLAQLVDAHATTGKQVAELQLQEASDDDKRAPHGRATTLAAERLRMAHAIADVNSQRASGALDERGAKRVRADADRLQARTAIAGYQRELRELHERVDDSVHGRQWLYNALVGAGVSNQLREGIAAQLATAMPRLQKFDDELVATASDRSPGADDVFATLRTRWQTFEAELVADDRGLVTVGRKVALYAELEKLGDDTVVEAGLTFGITAGVRVTVGAVRGGIVAARAAEAAQSAERAIEIARRARQVTAVGGFALEATALSGMQTAMHGGDMASGMIENMAANALTLGALKPLQSLARKWKVLDQTAGQLARAGKGAGMVAKRLAYVTSTMLVSAGVNFAVHRGLAVAKGEAIEQQTVTAWAVQGASMALGHALSTHFESDLQRFEKFGARGAGLVVRLREQRVLAATLEKTGDANAASELLIRHHQLLEDEIVAWREVADDPAAMHDAKISSDDVASYQVAAQHAQTELRSGGLVLAMAGLESEAAGTDRWAGTRRQIMKAVDNARRMNLPVREELDTTAGVWKLEIGDLRVQVRERADAFDRPTPTAAPKGLEAVHAIAPEVAAKVGAARFDKGRFTLELVGSAVVVEVHVGKAARATRRITNDGIEWTIEVPESLAGTELEAALVGKLTEVRIREARLEDGTKPPASSGLGEHGDGKAMTTSDHVKVAELRVWRSRAVEATGPEAEEASAHVHALEHELGIVGDSAEATKRRAAVDAMTAWQGGFGQRASNAKELDGTRGHAGIEVHNHFVGIVQPEVFRDRAARAAGGDPASWIPLMEHIAELGEGYQHKRDPVTGKILERTKTGDAIDHVRREQDLVRDLIKQAKTTKDPEVRGNLIHAAELLAREASKAGLNASPHSEYDSAYEVREAMIMSTFGVEAPGQGDPEFAKKMTPTTKTTQVTEDKQTRWNDYIHEAILQLKRDGVGYSEQSTGTKKVSGAMHPDIIKAVIDEMVKKGEIAPGEVDVRMIGMTLTGHFGEQSAHEKAHSPTTKPDPKLFEGDLERFKAQIHFDGVSGVDIGAPEKFWFDKSGGERLAQLYQLLLDHSAQTGQNMVLRPHVGEGVIDTEQGHAFHTDKNRLTVPGADNEPQLSHYDRARHNVEQWVLVFEHLQQQGLLDPKRVVVRFGHVTHATPDQMSRMQHLGIIAELNLGSNITSAVLSQTAQNASGPRSVHEKFEDHSFTAAIYYGVETILSTDGNAVMETSMREDYLRARKMIEGVLNGDRPVRIRADDAHGRGQVVSSRPEEREIVVGEMTGDERARFARAYEKLYDDAQRYYQRRPKPGFAATSDASPVAGSHHIDVAINQGLVPDPARANRFRGPPEVVEGAAREYRVRGYTVVRVSNMVTITSPDRTYDVILEELAP